MAKNEIQKLGLIKWASNQVMKFWPVSILFMAFTFLSQLDKIKQFSSYLSHGLSVWRNILRGLFEFPINLVLELLNYPAIRLRDPIPELLTFFLFFIFCILRADSLMKTKYAQKYHHFIRSAYAKMNEEKKQSIFKKILIFIVENLLKIITGIPSFVVMGVLLFRNPFLILPAFLVIWCLDRCFLRFRNAVAIYVSPLSHFIIFLALAIILLSIGLEQLIPVSEDFIIQAQ